MQIIAHAKEVEWHQTPLEEWCVPQTPCDACSVQILRLGFGRAPSKFFDWDGARLLHKRLAYAPRFTLTILTCLSCSESRSRADSGVIRLCSRSFFECFYPENEFTPPWFLTISSRISAHSIVHSKFWCFKILSQLGHSSCFYFASRPYCGCKI